MTIAEAQKTGEQILGSTGIASNHLDASLLLAKATGHPRSWLFAHKEEELDDQAVQDFMKLINQRSQRIPLVHLTNTREFYGLDFFIDKNVLTPRAETEKMVEYAIRYAPQHSRLVDIGTGSGAIAIAIGAHRPDLELWATDVSKVALEVARRNAVAHKIKLHLVVSNLFEQLAGRFSTVVTNLPYLEDSADLMPEVKKEPGVALFGGKDGLELYRRFFKQLPSYLEAEGCVFTECDPWQHAGMTKAATEARLAAIETTDYFILGFQHKP